MVIYLLSIMPSTWQGNYLSIYTRCKTGMLPIQLCRLHEHYSYCCDNFVAALASIAATVPLSLGSVGTALNLESFDDRALQKSSTTVALSEGNCHCLQSA